VPSARRAAEFALAALFSPAPQWQTPHVDNDVRTQIETAIANNRVILFMKGTRGAPSCGFSGRAVNLLDTLLDSYATVDVLAHPEIRDGIKDYSSWPTIPQLYVDGKFVGGTDIVTEMFENGTLHELLGVSSVQPDPPRVALTPRAAETLRGFLGEATDVLLVDIDGTFSPSLSIASAPEGALVIESSGVRLCVERRAWKRADGITIDYVDTAEGSAFKIDNPNEPPRVRPMSPRELDERRKRGEALRLIDVRTPGEWEIARIPGAELLDSELMADLQDLAKDTVLVFQCHHGHRSQRAAEQFLPLGFNQVYNLTGGIDAYSGSVDPSIPRY
jgi:monothiol glutaredoxin